MPRPKRVVPRDAVDDWPNSPSDDPAVEAARLLAVHLDQAAEDRSTRELAAVTGVSHTAIATLLSGRSWADAQTIARLEAGLGVKLWPDVGLKKLQ